jgi:TonB family protein
LALRTFVYRVAHGKAVVARLSIITLKLPALRTRIKWLGLGAAMLFVSSDEAARHLVKKVKAVYPEMAKIARIPGDVTVRFTISENGDVTDVQPVSGHPLLLEPAQTAIKQWRYTPFEFSGRRTSVVTSVVIAFPAGLPMTPEEKRKREVQGQFYGDLLGCTWQVEMRHLAEAEPLCRRAVAASNTLDPQDQLSRMEASKYMGHLLLFQGKAAEALQNYQEELSIAQNHQEELSIIQKAEKKEQDQLAGAHANVGNAKRGLDDLKGAVEHYEKAESIYRRISKDPASKSANNTNAYAFWQVLRSHAELLRQMGQPAAAASLEHEAAGIVVEEGPSQ